MFGFLPLPSKREATREAKTQKPKQKTKHISSSTEELQVGIKPYLPLFLLCKIFKAFVKSKKKQMKEESVLILKQIKIPKVPL